MLCERLSSLWHLEYLGTWYQITFERGILNNFHRSGAYRYAHHFCALARNKNVTSLTWFDDDMVF